MLRVEVTRAAHVTALRSAAVARLNAQQPVGCGTLSSVRKTFALSPNYGILRSFN
jgi:hypothetical protein